MIDRLIAAASGLALLVLAGAGLVAAGIAWAPCAAGFTSAACIAELESPSNWPLMLPLWLIATAVALVVFAMALGIRSPISAKLAGVSLAVVAVGAFPVLLDYIVATLVWTGIAPYDTLPGMGFVSSSLFAVGAVLLIWAAASARASLPLSAAVEPELVPTA